MSYKDFHQYIGELCILLYSMSVDLLQSVSFYSMDKINWLVVCVLGLKQIS